jgi:hypothetical protein
MKPSILEQLESRGMMSGATCQERKEKVLMSENLIIDLRSVAFI